MTNSSENLFNFLGYTLNLSTGVLSDDLQQKIPVSQIKNSTMHNLLAELITKYTFTDKPVKTNKLTNFKNFSGGYAYENAFKQRVVTHIVQLFGKKPSELLKAAKLIGGKQLEYADCSVEIETLPEIFITIILWTNDDDEELPPTANVLFDESSGKTFNAEDLAWLSDITVWRLSIAQTLA
jgi:hypothetical protein